MAGIEEGSGPCENVGVDMAGFLQHQLATSITPRSKQIQYIP